MQSIPHVKTLIRLSVFAGVVALGATITLAERGGEKPAEKGEGRQHMLGGPRADKAAATQPGGRGEMVNGPRPGALVGEAIINTLQEVNPPVTEEQKAKIKPIVEDFKKDAEAWREKNADQIAKLKKEGEAAREAKDEAKVRETMQKAMALREGGPKPKDLIDKIGSVLTPEQKTDFNAKIEKKRENLREGMEKRREMMEKDKGPRHMGKDKDGPSTQPAKKDEKLNL